MKLLRTIGPTVSAAALLGGLASVAAPASAASADSDSRGGTPEQTKPVRLAQNCWIRPGTPWRSGNTVAADITTTGCAGWSFTGNLQSSRWYGWANVVTKNWGGSQAWTFYDRNCGGVHDFRTTVTARNPADTLQPVQIGKTVTHNCG